MRTSYEGFDARTVEALSREGASLTEQFAHMLTVHETNAEMIAAMARQMLTDYRSHREFGRSHCVMIVPVGPVGQYELIAQHCMAENLSLQSLTLVVMDEYLDASGKWISEDDPLSFRAHMKRHLHERLPKSLRPAAILVPDPSDPGHVARRIGELGGVDVCYAGVGITGHLAFNDPVPGRDDPDWFASLPTRIVQLSAETRLINSVTAAGGNTARIPFSAITVGMREILSARILRIWMNRDWQRAAIRRMLLGPVTAAFPASLVQRHKAVTADVVTTVLQLPEPELR